MDRLSSLPKLDTCTRLYVRFETIAAQLVASYVKLKVCVIGDAYRQTDHRGFQCS